MSSGTTSYASGILTTQFDTTKLFGIGCRFRSGTYTAGGGGATLLKGTLMGRITSSGKLTPALSTATNGSQVPVGILAHDYTVGASATVTVLYCYCGDVNAGKLVFSNGTDTLATALTLTDSGSDTVPIGIIEDQLVCRQINPVTFDENTLADN